jgi:PEP-CTERM motif
MVTSAVPEPGTWAMFLLGAGWLVVRAKRKA